MRQLIFARRTDGCRDTETVTYASLILGVEGKYVQFQIKREKYYKKMQFVLGELHFLCYTRLEINHGGLWDFEKSVLC